MGYFQGRTVKLPGTRLKIKETHKKHAEGRVDGRCSNLLHLDGARRASQILWAEGYNPHDGMGHVSCWNNNNAAAS